MPLNSGWFPGPGNGDAPMRWFLSVAAVTFTGVFVVRAEKLDPSWVALLGSMMGIGVLALGGRSDDEEPDDHDG